MSYEQTPWKPIVIAAAVSLVMLLLVYFSASRKPGSWNTQRIEKAVKFGPLRLLGKEKGNKRWEFKAEGGWSASDQSVSVLRNISEGMAYNDKGDTIIWDLRARMVKAYRASKDVEAFSSGETTGESKLLTAKMNLGRKGKERISSISADFLRYNPETKTSELGGSARIERKDFVVNAQKILINHDKEEAIFPETLSLTMGTMALKADRGKYLSASEELDIEGNILSKIQERGRRTIIKSSAMKLPADKEINIEASGSLEVRQAKKLAIADRAVYNRKAKIITLAGKVHTVVEKGSGLISERTAKKLSDPEAKKLLKNKVIITSDRLIIAANSGNARAEGNVVVFQKGNEAKSEIAEYSEANDRIVLVGNVYLKKENEWVKANKVIVDVKNETFEAVGGVETEFKLKKK